MVKREDKKRNTREKLMHAAALCFAEKGYSDCSVADIARRAGIAQGTLYVHFRNKEELFTAMIEEEHAQGAEKAGEALNAPPHLDGIIGLLAGCVRDVGFPVDHRLWTEILAVTARDQGVRAAFAASDTNMRGVFAELLRKAAEAGEIDGGLDFDAVAVWLYALADGLIARTADDPGFDFRKHLAVFDLLVRRALSPESRG